MAKLCVTFMIGVNNNVCKLTRLSHHILTDTCGANPATTRVLPKFDLGARVKMAQYGLHFEYFTVFMQKIFS